jgi:hypothetical protein
MKTKTPRKPVGWKNTFDKVLSLKKCPPGENLPNKYRDDFKFIGRTRLDIKTLTRSTEIQVRQDTVKNANVNNIARSLNLHGYLHDKYPPIVIRKKEVVNSKTVERFELWIGNNRINAAEKEYWKDFPCDVYECSNPKALLTVSCTTNWHKGPFAEITKYDYLNTLIRAAYGTKTIPRVLGNGKRPTREEIQEYAEEITGSMVKPSELKYMVKNCWEAREIDNKVEAFQPYSLTGKGANSVEDLAKGNNQYAPTVRIPFKGNEHDKLPDNKIKQLGYSIPDKGQGFRDNIPNAIRESVVTGKSVLFYLYIVDIPTKPFSDVMIDNARAVALIKYQSQLSLFLDFASEISGVDKTELDQSRFKLVGFLPQKIGVDSKTGNIKESTIVDIDGKPVDSLTGELLK